MLHWLNQNHHSDKNNHDNQNHHNNQNNLDKIQCKISDALAGQSQGLRVSRS